MSWEEVESSPAFPSKDAKYLTDGTPAEWSSSMTPETAEGKPVLPRSEMNGISPIFELFFLATPVLLIRQDLRFFEFTSNYFVSLGTKIQKFSHFPVKFREIMHFFDFRTSVGGTLSHFRARRQIVCEKFSFQKLHASITRNL